jgi:aspartate/methionine/tyrosine aminotransferase
MTELERINRAIADELPAVSLTLSDLGRRAIFPRGIPFQSAQAKGTRYNATIGQVTDGHGGALPLPALRDALAGLSASMSHLYSPPSGHLALRQAWQRRQRALSNGSSVATTLPFVTGGLSQGLSFLAELLVDPGRPVLVPRPRWGNYDQTFGFRRGGRLVSYDLFEGTTFSLRGLDEALESTCEPAVLLLNFPHNPTGYCPDPGEVAAMVERIAAHPYPLVVVVDDAYAGMLYLGSPSARSMFWDLAKRVDRERHAVIRLDGATKELLFFPGRVGFITIALPADSPAAEALESKFGSLARSSVGSPSGPGQAAVLHALEQTDLEEQIASANRVLGRRAVALQAALQDMDCPWLRPYPFHGGVFALVGVHGIADVDALRLFLIEEESVGVCSIAAPPALRLAYCSVDEQDIPELVQRLARGVQAFAAKHDGV